jgi:glycosyltransferase involved in cell wall biosynthesis
VHEGIQRAGLTGVVKVWPPTPAIAAFLARVDALVLPSRYEGFPNVLLEAMALRVPAIATAVGDVPAMIRDGATGFVVPPGDPEALARALLALRALGPRARAALGERGRDHVEENFRIDTMADRHLALYEQLLAQRPTAPSVTR